MSFMILSHGGLCCGMTHIWHFPSSPSTELPSVEYTPEQWQANSNLYRGLLRFERPGESAEARLKAAVEFVTNEMVYPRGAYTDEQLLNMGTERRGRPRGIIEAVLIANQCTHWRKTIETLGFKEVNKAINSNSGNTIHVFHLNTGQ